MTRIALLLALIAGCNKPSDTDCRAALENMRRILGTDDPSQTAAELEPDVRACRGSSKKDAVECAKNAKTEDDLKACGFMSNVKPRTAPKLFGSDREK